MRVTGGLYGGRILKSPEDLAIRPTSDKVRLAIFNMLEARGLVDDAFVLDAFAGTGAMGLEALSRGAREVIFFEKERDALALTRTNIRSLDVEAQTTVILRDVTKCGPRPETMPVGTLVFLDPPYRQNLINPALEALVKNKWISADAFIVAEIEDELAPDTLHMRIETTKNYGDTVIVLGQPIVPE